MFKKKFKEFDFLGFSDFIFELIDKYKMNQISFRPEHKELFSQYQLTHIAPHRIITHREGFIWAWMQQQKDVRRVSFDLFSEDGKRKISMTINLDEKTISLDIESGISSIEVEDILIKNIKNLTSENSLRDSEKLEKKRSQKFWEKPWFQIIILLSAIATIIGIFLK